MKRKDKHLSSIKFIVNREVRIVSLDWQHPKDKQGRLVPLFLEDMPATAGLPANRLGLIVYETTSEGTPCSPVSPNTAEGREALVDHCVKHVSLFADQMGTRADWEQVILQGEVIAVAGGNSLRTRKHRSTTTSRKSSTREEFSRL